MMKSHARCRSDARGSVSPASPVVTACLAVVLTQLPGVVSSAVADDSANLGVAIRAAGAMFGPERGAQIETPDVDTPGADTIDFDIPDVDIPDVETQDVESQDVESQDVETPDVESPDVESPDVESPDVESQDVESQDVESPDVETQDVESPDVESQDVETPDVETPDVETQDVETQGVETQDVETPDVETPDVETPDVETQDVQTPDVETPDVETPDVETPDVETQDVETQDVETQDVETQDVETPNAGAPDAGADTAVADAPDAADPAAIARLESALEQLTERTGVLADTVAASEQKQRSREQALDDLTRRVERQASRLDAAQTGDTAARVLSLVNRAADDLGSAGDVEAAVAALELARRQAGAAEGYAEVTSAIDAYLGDLAARVGDDSVPRLRADLERRCADVPALPARPLPNPKPPLERVTEAAPRDVDGWRDVFASLWQDLMDQVSVRSVDEAAPQVRPEQVAYARVALFGLCDAIDGALAARDGDRARRYAGTAAGMARATFDPEDAKVQAFVGFLDGVAATEVPAYPSFAPIVETLSAALAPADGAAGD